MKPIALKRNWVRASIAETTFLAFLVLNFCEKEICNAQFTQFGTSSSFILTNVASIIQDRKGFLWFGCSNGLYRYDGFSFQPFKHDQDNPHSISDDNINVICEDRDGFIWVGTRHGLNRFNPATELFNVILPDSSKKHWITANEMVDIKQDHNGTIWIATPDRGLYKMIVQKNNDASKEDISHVEFIQFKHDSTDEHSIANDHVYSIYFDNMKYGWACTGEGLCRFKEELPAVNDLEFETFRHAENDRNSITDGDVWKLYEDKQHHLWVIGSTNMLDRIEEYPSNKKVMFQHAFPAVYRQIPEQTNYLVDFMIDRKGYGWLGTVNGLYRFQFHQSDSDFAVSNPQSFFPKEGDEHSISSSRTWISFQDRSGLVWVGGGGGISQFNPSRDAFNAFDLIPKQIKFQELKISTLFYDKEKNLWLGSDSNCIWVVNKNIQRKVILKSDHNPSPQLENNIVRKILRSRDGTLYIGSDDGLFILSSDQADQIARGKNISPSFHHLHRSFDGNAKIPSSSVICLVEDQSGNVWIGTGNGLAEWQPSQKKIVVPYTATGAESGGNIFIIRDLLIESKGIMWLATDDGLVQFDPVTRTIKNFRQVTGDSKSITGHLCFTLLEPTDNTLWIGTTTGLSEFDREHNSFTNYTMKNGLCSDRIVSMLEDDHGIIWIGTQNGLSKFDRNRNTFTNFFEEDGLPANLFYWGSSFRTQDNLLFFGSNKGFISFYPENVPTNEFVPPISLTDFKLFGVSVLQNGDSGLKKNFLSGNQLLLRYNQNFFSFDFAALNFINPGKNKYAYKLDGIDEDWVYCNNLHTANYTSIPFGNYLFHVKAANNNDVWNESGISMPITILPPWWQTWWFQGALAMAMAGLIFGAIRFYIRRRLEKQQTEIDKQRIKELLNTQEIKSLNAMMEGQDKERKRIAADLHDRIGSSLSAIKLHLGGVAKSLDAPEQKQVQFAKVSSMFDEVVKEVRQVSHDLASGVLMKFGLVSALKDLSEGIESSGGIRIKFYTHGVDERLNQRTEISLYRITQEIVSNILKHSQAREITIQLTRDNDDLLLMVEDDGVGFDPVKAAGGMGMKNIRSRVSHLHGNVFFDSSPGKGCTVTIEVPITVKI